MFQRLFHRLRPTLGLAFLGRQWVLLGAAVVAYLLRVQVNAGTEVLWVLGASAGANLLIFLASQSSSSPFGRAMRSASPYLAILGWLVLAHFTGGARSPFLAGLWFEILLTAWTGWSPQCLLVTAVAILGLWLQEMVLGVPGIDAAFGIRTGFLAVFGAASFGFSRRLLVTRWSREADFSTRLAELEEELRTLRVLGRVGEQSAQVAHGLKNAAHSLRGLVRLVETRMDEPTVAIPALQGISRAVDQMEALSREILTEDHKEYSGRGASTTGGELRKLLDETVMEVGLGHPRVRWQLDTRGIEASVVSIPPCYVKEIITDLCRNAAEAMNGMGLIEITGEQRAERVLIHIRDHGPGMAPESVSRLFQAGQTTKAKGTGFGLYLARQLLSGCRGDLLATPALGGGMTFSASLPHVATGDP